MADSKHRYEIPATGAAGWNEAEKQIKEAVRGGGSGEGKSTVVSVKTGKSKGKRKVGESAAEIYEKEVEATKYKKPKKGKR